MLSDPKKRVEYDQRGFAGVAGFAPEDLFRGINFEDIFGGLNFDFGGGIFDAFFGRPRRGPPRGANIEVEVVVPLERIATGGEQTVTVLRPGPCAACGGSGARAGTAPRRCSACGGSGTKVTTQRQKDVSLQRISECPACGGRGTVIDQPCASCGGRGEVETSETLTVRIPPGVEDGTALRVPGHGLPSAAPGGIPGDLFVVVRSARDPRFERAGAQLWRTETIELADAVLGTTLNVPTLRGTARTKVPPGTQPDTVLRLRGEGLPEFGSHRRGDLYLRVKVRVPEHVTAEERKLFERLRALGRTRG